jgi:hypothetical protein
MDSTQIPSDDAFEQILSGQGDVAPNHELQASLRSRTTRLLRRRVMLRRCAFAGALVACYVAGALTVVSLPTGSRPNPDALAKNVVRPGEGLGPVEPAPNASSVPADQEKTLTASALEWQAVDGQDQRPQLLRSAGDRYLDDANDFQGALRCYRNLLDTPSEEATTISADDNWLLMALKEAKQKERYHATIAD